MRIILLITLIIGTQTILNGQGIQSYPNSYIPIKQFWGFLHDVSESEETLLKYDFILTNADKITEGRNQVGSFAYRLNHTLNTSSGKYAFDIYRIYDKLRRFMYMTSSLKNFIHYKKALRVDIERDIEEINRQNNRGKIRLSAEILDISSSEYIYVMYKKEEVIDKKSGKSTIQTTKMECHITYMRDVYLAAPNYKIIINVDEMIEKD